MILIYITRKYSVAECRDGRFAVIDTGQSLRDPYSYHDSFRDAQKALFKLPR